VDTVGLAACCYALPNPLSPLQAAQPSLDRTGSGGAELVAALEASLRDAEESTVSRQRELVATCAALGYAESAAWDGVAILPCAVESPGAVNALLDLLESGVVGGPEVPVAQEEEEEEAGLVRAASREPPPAWQFEPAPFPELTCPIGFEFIEAPHPR